MKRLQTPQQPKSYNAHGVRYSPRASGLFLTGTELDIMSIMGMTMIVGIVTETAIFFYTEYAEMPAGDTSAQRLIAAGIGRIRAIAMTTIAAILSLMTLALGIGQGSALLQPLAIAIIARLIAQFPLVLIVLPAILRLFRTGKESATHRS